MQNNNLSLILFDFHNVLSRGRFYSTLENTNPEQYKMIMHRLFSPQSYDFIAKWMRGEISFQTIHKLIAEEVSVSAHTLDEALIESVKQIELNHKMMEFSQNMRELGVSVAILTDNMDVFSDIYVPHVQLDKKFDGIFASNIYKKLKSDGNGEFIFEAISKMGADTKNTLFIDDCAANGQALIDAGGTFYHYDKYIDGHEDFVTWFKKQFFHHNNEIWENE